MKPIEVEVTNFFCHPGPRRFEYRRGLTLVVGRNGVGKSTIAAEAIYWAVYGSTLRGTTPRTRGILPTAVTTVKAVFLHDGATYRVRRDATAKRTTFSWSRDGAAPFEYETSTKAQAALEAEVGDADLWRATHLFAGDDAAMFSRASDTQRKKLLERMLGLERLDAAADNSRKSLNSMKVQLQSLRSQADRTAGEIQGLTQSLEQLEQVGGFKGSVAETQAALTKTKQQLAEAETTSQKVAAALAKARLETDAAAREVTRVLGGRCVACNQPVPEDVLAAQTQKVNEAELRYATASAKYSKQSRELGLEISAMRGRVQALQGQAVQATAAAQFQQRVYAISDRLGELYETSLQLESDLGQVELDYEIQEHVVRVLGPKGVRARRLQKVLGSISTLANAYLTWLSPGIRVRLLPYTELASGATNEQFSMVVEGVGDGKYASASGGERRRIDIALVLALAQLRKSDTIIMDDLMDALDKPGVEAVCRLLVDLAQRRDVVLLTHTQNQELLDLVSGYADQVEAL